MVKFVILSNTSSFFFQLESLATIAIVVWLIFEADFLTVVASSKVFMAAIALWICVGALLLFTAIMGLAGAWRKSRTLLKLVSFLISEKQT